ncbi:NTP transferase domain-containing protein [Shewanella profunda]|uniref:cytidylyltransferase domain-containing protein n=1 Tax=Shewanella profunda TaxID=254793 RepID=UPI00200F622A|nr:NTP transferase domain-containing protein [Shewanella profunda]MCL1090793.1 NTP transferase domain-containing protein [Shewanella profunda]
MKTIAIVGARLNSSRLSGKHMLHLAGKPMIEHLWRRLTRCKEIDDIILATTADDYNRPLVNWAQDKNVSCFTFEGDVNDLMGRLDAVINTFQPQYIVYICGDCPLVDPGFIDHAIKELKLHPLKDSIVLAEGVMSIHEGMAFYSFTGWKKLLAASQSDMSREHVGYADKLTPVLEKLSIIDSDDFSAIKHRISVDTYADYLFMDKVYQRWFQENASDSIVNLKWVQLQLQADPVLRGINSHVRQKRPDTHYKRVHILCHVGKDIGMGHLKRSAFIANLLQEHLSLGVTVHIVGDKRTDLPWLQSTAIWYKNEQSALSQMLENSTALWIVDIHPQYIDKVLLNSALTKAKSANTKLLAIDKTDADIDSLVDAIFVPAFFCQSASDKTTYGWSHYLFTPQKIVSKEKRVLVTTGGSDALQYGSWLPAIIETQVPPTYDITWVQGPYADKPKLPNQERWTHVINPENLPELMAKSEIVICCYGISLFEAIASGTITLLLPTDSLCELQELDALEKAECCLISHSRETITQDIQALFTAENQKFRELCLSNAYQHSLQIDGGNKLCQLVNHIIEEIHVKQ